MRRSPLQRRRSGIHSHARRLGVERLEQRWVLSATVAGQVIHDVDADGVVDAGEPGQAGVHVYLDANDNGQLDTVGSWLEPDDYSPGQDLTSVLPGVTLSVVNDDGQPIAGKSIQAVFDSKGIAPSGDLVFGFDASGAFYDTARLRMDFASPVSSVAIDYVGSLAFATEFGRLETYDSLGRLLQTVTTPGLKNGEWATLLATRTEQDIAFAEAFTVVSLGGGTGRLDALRINAVGSETWTVTNANGHYDFPHLDAGSYRVSEVVPTGYVQTLPGGDGSQRVNVAVDQQLQGVDFANRDAVRPTAQGDVRTTRVNVPIVINVLANDVAGDFPLDPTTVSVVLDPTSGTTSVDPVEGRITFTPATDFAGAVSFRYTVQDTQGLTSNEATVGVQVSNQNAPWQNPLNPLDVDNDPESSVIAFDALLVINELNEPQYRNPVTGELPAPPDPIPAYFDVSGDNMATPFDALLIINYLNSLTPAASPVWARVATGSAAESASLAPADLAAALAADPADAVDRVVDAAADASVSCSDESLSVPTDDPLTAAWQSVFETPASSAAASIPVPTAALDEDLLVALALDITRP